MDYETLSTGRESRLHGQLWVNTDAPKGVLILVHGLGDHADRFAGVAEAIYDHWAVFAFDLPGHGRSPGKPGQVSGFTNLLGDIAAASQTMADRFADLPQVFLGHSMGGNLAANYVLRRQELAPNTVSPQGLILCAPMLLPPRPMPRPIIFAAWLTGYLFPFFRFGHPVDPEELTSDPDEVQAIKNDTMMHSKISMHLATQLVAQGRWAIDQARHVQIPTLIQLGEDDSMIDQAACNHFAIRIGDSTTLQTFPQTKHALFHDKSRADVIDQLKQWLRHVVEPNL
ncbi:Phospholipase YtpA [Rubripirellula obstinata]|uniref:Phospholipase YtpA n=1 Tax=Rubripirellula obstinata TaxID=406547 RepID=A0A5B1CJM8_9BACT|nr:alpha/beta fold hydrolase [Rubripirellula obstinata]KAA1259514.1 Phospholipase YtpA [Rubripirellula obstinata]